MEAMSKKEGRAWAMARKSKYRDGLTVGEYLEAVAWYQYALYKREGEEYDADKWGRIVGAIIRRMRKGDALSIDRALYIIDRAQDSRYARTSYDRLVKACKADSEDASALQVLYTMTCNDTIESPELGYIADENARDFVKDCFAKSPAEKVQAMRAERDTHGLEGIVRQELEDPARVNSWRVFFHRRAGYAKRLHLSDLIYLVYKYI
jgi:hypothetical protein